MRGPFIIFFNKNGDTLAKESKDILDAAANAAGNCGERHAMVVGHSDIDERKDAAKRRAKSARTYLEAHGVPRRNISIIDKGSREPRIPNRDGKPEEQNRRVEVFYGSH